MRSGCNLEEIILKKEKKLKKLSTKNALVRERPSFFVSQFYNLTLTVKSQKIIRTFLNIWWPMPLFFDIYFTCWYRYNMEVDEKSDTYNILVWVCLWFCRLDVVFFDYFNLFQWIAGEEDEERAVVSSASSVSSTETRQVLMTSPRRPSSTVRKQTENRINVVFSL